ncbi:hypothetical protein EVAR_38339_1 [Eumeta japonica]|uniref:Uncharacterized protein n=1 Tax=Eumeta variegata TaxID=151549 RepID=A0A4C1X7E6_EUMVA|nr:hypothetical protein EVAR_38339_1 [Eumeta japonica]
MRRVKYRPRQKYSYNIHIINSTQTKKEVAKNELYMAVLAGRRVVRQMCGEIYEAPDIVDTSQTYDTSAITYACASVLDEFRHRYLSVDNLALTKQPTSSTSW